MHSDMNICVCKIYLYIIFWDMHPLMTWCTFLQTAETVVVFLILNIFTGSANVANLAYIYTDHKELFLSSAVK